MMFDIVLVLMMVYRPRATTRDCPYGECVYMIGV